MTFIVVLMLVVVLLWLVVAKSLNLVVYWLERGAVIDEYCNELSDLYKGFRKSSGSIDDLVLSAKRIDFLNRVYSRVLMDMRRMYLGK